MNRPQLAPSQATPVLDLDPARRLPRTIGAVTVLRCGAPVDAEKDRPCAHFSIFLLCATTWIALDFLWTSKVFWSRAIIDDYNSVR
jgi:hypothetical protein